MGFPGGGRTAPITDETCPSSANLVALGLYILTVAMSLSVPVCIYFDGRRVGREAGRELAEDGEAEVEMREVRVMMKSAAKTERELEEELGM